MSYDLNDLLKDRTLFLGTGNKKKIVELEQALEPRGYKLKTPSDLPNPIDVEETGSTFLENAKLKAIAQAKHTGLWSIGEDSGLCVVALDGAPGIFSARYSGANANDATNNALLLERMAGIPLADRDAYYISTIALADPSGTVHIEVSGECWGRILNFPRGEGGFGYDPLFEIRELHRTFAELGLNVKRAISHRGRSLRAFLARLDNLAQVGGHD
ncbi:RdgB/HAM1 family non-canonical purine NTP pyrophosphatase [Pirellulaceae bacterium SH449]